MMDPPSRRVADRKATAIDARSVGRYVCGEREAQKASDRTCSPRKRLPQGFNDSSTREINPIGGSYQPELEFLQTNAVYLLNATAATRRGSGERG